MTGQAFRLNPGLIFLLVFTPLAFGTVEPWSVAILELAAFGILFLHAANHGLALPTRRRDRAILALFLLLIGVVLLQLLPLPDATLNLLSPGALAVWRKFSGAPAGIFLTASLCPDATRQELLKLLAYAAVYVVVIRETRTRDQIRSLAVVIVVTGSLLALFAIVQKLSWNGRIFWLFPVSEAKRSGSGIWGPFINRNHFAGYLAMVIPLGLGLLLSVVRDAGDLKGTSWGRRLERTLSSDGLAPAAGLFLLVLMLSAVLLSTRSRGGAVAWVVSSCFFAWLTWRRRSQRPRALISFLAAAAVGVVVLLPSLGRIQQRFEDIDEKDQVGRLSILNDSLGIVEDFPLIGSGLGTFGQVYRLYQTTRPRLFYDHAHNDYMELATDTGAAGVLLVSGIVVILCFSLIRGWRGQRSRFCRCIGAGGLSSCLAIAVHGGTDFNLRIPANALLFTVIAGLATAAVFRNPETPECPPVEETAAPSRRALRGRLQLWLGVLPLGLLLYFPVRSLLADHHFRQVARILDDKGTPELDILPLQTDTLPDYARAISAVERAVALEPSRSAYPQASAELHARLGAWAKSMESLRAPLPRGALAGDEALRRGVAAAQRTLILEPTNPDAHLVLGQLYAAADGNFERAAPEIRLALAAHPASTPLRYAAATTFLQAGRSADALLQARELARLDDSYLIRDSAEKTLMIARRSPAYLALLKNSYLFHAFEIARRATGSIQEAKSISPLNDDAQAVLELYLEWSGAEE